MRGHGGIGYEDVDAGIVQDIKNLLGLEEVIDRHHDGAAREHREQGRDELRTVLQPKADTVARLDAHRLQFRCEQARLGEEQLVAILFITPKDRRLLRVAVRSFGERSDEVHFAKRSSTMVAGEDQSDLACVHERRADLRKGRRLSAIVFFKGGARDITRFQVASYGSLWLIPLSLPADSYG